MRRTATRIWAGYFTGVTPRLAPRLALCLALCLNLCLNLSLPLSAAAGAPRAGSTAEDPARELLLDPSHPAWETPAPDLYRVRFETTAGTFTVQFDRRWAPRGVDRVYNLVRAGFYDDTRVYRVRAGFIAQFGLSGDPAINEVWYARTMADDPPRRSNARGMVAFADLPAAATRTTQLFVNLDDNTQLDAQGFAPVGRVVEGMDVVAAFYSGYDESAGGGMRAGNQGRIVREGNAHLDADFPRLDGIVRATIEPGQVQRYPSPGGNRIRVEAHLLPAVSSGPQDPSWSPDGSRLALSLRGDIWTVAADGGTATQLTWGPAYHFEPAWSPDGTRIAFSRDLDGNLDIGVVAATGGDEVLLTTDPQIDVQPAWSADSRSVYFASARAATLSPRLGFDLYRVDLDRPATPEAVVSAPGHQIFPSLSPRGELAFVSPVAGRLGAGGIWRLDPTARSAAEDRLDAAELVHVEETSYRVRPSWGVDGETLLFVSDAAGSDDLAVVPRVGGSVARLTEDAGGEHAPAMSPAGDRLAFVSNRNGPPRLYTAPAGGARRAGWSPVEVEIPHDGLGTLQIRIEDPYGAPMPARVSVIASDGRGYAPAEAFHRVASATDQHYFHSDGESELLVPAGPVRVEVSRGFEHQLGSVGPTGRDFGGFVEVVAGEGAVVGINPALVHGASRPGWYSGETHAHDLHQGRYGLDHRGFFRQLLAEDLRVTNALIHMDGTRIMGRWDDLTGEPHPLSTPEHILQYAQEFRGSFGHVGLLGVSEFITPLIGGTPGTAFAADVLNFPYIEAAEAQGGLGGFMHPYTGAVDEPADGAGSEIALDVALGHGRFFDVACIWYDELANAQMYYRFLNAGFRLAATGGSDNFADVWRDPPPGTARTYAHVAGELSVPAWLDAVRAGRTFATTGPLLFMTVDGVEPGEELAIAGDGPTGVEVRLDLVSVAPVDRVEVLVNGRVVWGQDVRGRGMRPDGGRQRLVLEQRIEVPEGGWVAARAIGPPSRLVTDSYAFAQTSPVWVVRAGTPWVSAADAHFLAEMVRALWARVQARDRFATEADRETYRAAAEAAIAVYEARARGASGAR